MEIDYLFTPLLPLESRDVGKAAPMRLAMIIPWTLTHSSFTRRRYSTVANSQLPQLILVLVATAFACICPTAYGQANEWTWMGGDETAGIHAGVYGTREVPALANTPGTRSGASSWTDRNGDLWLFGGRGYDAVGNGGDLNDLWEFDPPTQEWRWMGGSATVPVANEGSRGVYGKLGVAAADNVPGGRVGASSWTDKEGNLWLFGGAGYDSNGGMYGNGLLNDLWKFDPATNEWTWMSGSSTVPVPYGARSGIYGTLGVPAAGNVPGGRQLAVAWVGRGGNLWLFGGEGPDSKGNYADLNDLWKFDPTTKEWTWISGSDVVTSQAGPPGVYGKRQVPAPENVPGGRDSSVGWVDGIGNLWLFGGWGRDSGADSGDLNDLWEFDPSTHFWIWMGGNSTIAPTETGWNGIYGTIGKPAAGNIPGGREWASSWSDSRGNFWLFGGDGLDSNGNRGPLEDIWEFNSGDDEWAWMGGSRTVPGYDVCQFGVYGTPGIPSATNSPGGRDSATTWSDSDENLWLFGGSGCGLVPPGYPFGGGDLNDLWEFRPSAPIGPAATPTFSIAAGTYTAAKQVEIRDTTLDSTIYYTLDDSTPGNESTKYKSAIAIDKTTTIRAIAMADGYADSAVATAKYLILKAQIISWAKITGTYHAGSKLTLKATASSGLMVRFASETPKVCAVSKATASLLAAGNCIIRATRPGNAVYGSAPPVSQTIAVKAK